jgi:hypothetical protein
MKNFTPEMIAAAKNAKTHEELFELAKANNVEITEEEAKTYFKQLNAVGEVADDELGAVAGGNDDQDCSSDDGEDIRRKCPFCGRKATYIYKYCQYCGKMLIFD